MIMKKITMLLILIFGFATVQAQETTKNDTYVQKGDLVEATLYFDNGEVSQMGFYTEKGIPTGVWFSYNREGEKTAKSKYNNGVKVGTWLFWSDDKITEVDYNN